MKNNSNNLEERPTLTVQGQILDQRSNGKWMRLAMLAVAGLAAACLAGCDPGKYTGGGFIGSAAGGKEKATFGFNFEALDRDGDGAIDVIEEPFFNPDDPTEIWYIAVWSPGKGQFNYDDHAAGVKFHFDMDEISAMDADGNVESSVGFTFEPPTTFPFNPADLVYTGMIFNGPYTSKAGNGQVSATIHAKGDAFDSAEDTIEINLFGGPYDGYHNSGTIQGGNIQWHPANSK